MINDGVTLGSSNTNSIHAHLTVKLIEGGWLFNSTLKTIEYEVRRMGLLPSERSIRIRQLNPDAKLIYQSAPVNAEIREAFFSGKSLVFDFGIKPVSGKSYYLELSWRLANDASLYELNMTTEYTVNSYDYLSPWTTNSMPTTDPDKNKNLIADSYENNSPNKPSIISPADGATAQSSSPTLSWNCSDPNGDALTYDVYFGTSNNPTTTIATDLTATSISRSGLANNTTYYWKIVAKDSKSAIATGIIWSFTTAANRPPEVPYWPDPPYGATGISISPTLSWTCSDPDGDVLTYDVYFGTSFVPPLVSSGQKGTTLQRSGLSNNTTYYWKVVAKDGKGGSTSGADLSFTTVEATNNPPNEPSNPFPATGATDQSTSPTLSWSCSDPNGDALTYSVYFGTSSNPTTAIATNQSATSISRSDLVARTTYYWKIVAKDSKNTTTEGPVWSFTTLNSQAGLPDLIILSYTYSPLNPTTSDEITFTAVVKNTGNAPAATSQLQFTIGGESNPPIYNIPSLAANETYTATRKETLSAQAYGSLITIDPNNQIAESFETNNSFEISFEVIVNPILSMPSVSTTAVTSKSTISAIVEGNVTYDGGSPVTDRGVYWGTAENPESTGSLLQIGSGSGAFSQTLSGLTPGTTYFVKAYATNDLGTAYGA
jgi:hypothetical protein